ncbi:9812_t:CDS:2, partial [Acaulospora colombiana]
MRLPIEIMVQIFQLRVSQDVETYLDKASQEVKAYLAHSEEHLPFPCTALTLSHVCWSWRLIANEHSERSSLEIYMQIEEKKERRISRPKVPDLPDSCNLHFIMRSTLNRLAELPFQFKSPKSLNFYYTGNGRLPALYVPERICSTRLSRSLKSIEELRFVNDELIIDPDLTKIFTLSNLKVLGITPSHKRLSQLLQLPALESVIFYPMSPSNYHHSASFDSLALLVSNATNLHLHGWPKRESSSPSGSASAFAAELLRHPTKFTSVIFSHCFVTCPFLIQPLPGIIAQGTGSGAMLMEIHFDNCTGVKESDCIQLRRE